MNIRRWMQGANSHACSTNKEFSYCDKCHKKERSVNLVDLHSTRGRSLYHCKVCKQCFQVIFRNGMPNNEGLHPCGCGG